MKVIKSERGFERMELPKYVRDPCVVGQSSIVGNYPDSLDRPGTSALWVGDSHLDREQVAELREHLTAWLTTGSLEGVST